MEAISVAAMLPLSPEIGAGSVPLDDSVDLEDTALPMALNEPPRAQYLAPKVDHQRLP